MIRCFHEVPGPDHIIFPGHSQDSGKEIVLRVQGLLSWASLNLLGTLFPHLKIEATNCDSPRVVESLKEILNIKHHDWHTVSADKCKLLPLPLLVFHYFSSLCCKTRMLIHHRIAMSLS